MSADNVELLRGLYARWEQGDFSGAREAFDPELVLMRIVPAVADGAGGAGTWTGLDEAGPALGAWVRQWDDLRVRAEEFIDLGDRVLVLTRQTARGKVSGTPVDTELGEILTMRDGKIARWEIYWDRQEARRAAGLDSSQ